MLPHRCDISSKGPVLPGCNDAEMGLANSLHASANYSEYNERFDLIFSLVIWRKISTLKIVYQLQEISKLLRANLNIAMRRFRSKTLAKRRYKPAKMRTITFCSGHRRHPFDIKFGSFVHENSSVAVTMTLQKLHLAKQKETVARPRPRWMNYIDN